MRKDPPMRGGGIVLAATLCVSVALGTPSDAGASAIHSGRTQLPPPENPPTIGTAPKPADQREEVQREVEVQYNAPAGTVTFRVEVWDAEFWGERLEEGFFLGRSCAEGSAVRFSPPSQRHPQAFHGHVSAHPKNLLHEAEVTGSATLEGYAGQVESTGTFDGHHFEITFSSPAFKNRNWRCAATPLIEERQGSRRSEYRDFALGGWLKPEHSRKRHR